MFGDRGEVMYAVWLQYLGVVVWDHTASTVYNTPYTWLQTYRY